MSAEREPERQAPSGLSAEREQQARFAGGEAKPSGEFKDRVVLVTGVVDHDALVADGPI